VAEAQVTYQQRLTYEVELLRAIHRLYLALTGLYGSKQKDRLGPELIRVVNAVRGLYVLLTSELREEVSRRMGGDVLEATDYIAVAEWAENGPFPVIPEYRERARREIIEEIRNECIEKCGEKCIEGCGGREAEFKRACESEAYKKVECSYSSEFKEYVEKCVEEKAKACVEDCRSRLSKCVEKCVEERSRGEDFKKKVDILAFRSCRKYWESYASRFMMTVVDVLAERGLLLRETELFKGVVGGEEP